MYVYVPDCVHVHRVCAPPVPGGTIGCAGSGDTGEVPDVVLGTDPESSARTQGALNH